MRTERQQLEAGVAAMEAQRSLLGDAVVDAALAGLHAKLATLHAASNPEINQALKQVTILFLDVVGSTALSQRLDPEEISAVMDDALARGTVIVDAFRGRVLQYAGDNILAAFGADQASEDDPERAVRCGLALLELGKTLGIEILGAHAHSGFNVRVGIHTGCVLLGGGVDETDTIRGVAVNVAARMEQTAPPGGLRISHATYVHVRGMFEVAPQEPLAVKGVDEPVLSNFVLKSKPRSFRIGSRGIEGVVTRMIGRDAEFEALQNAFKRLLADRRMMLVSVVAEAGVGKSRLLSEFEAWVEDRSESVFLFRGRSTPQTQGQPFGLLRDIVAWRFHLGDDDTLDEAKAKIEQGLIPLFADEPDFAQAHAHLLGHLIGVDWKESPHLRGILNDAKQIRNRAQHAAAQMFRRVSKTDGSPVLLQLEDLHWADDESLDFLNYLTEVNRDVPMLILAFARPTLFERRPDWPMAAMHTDGRHQRIDLYPLDKTGSRTLASELLKKLPDFPVALRELLTGGSEGNPFYMEELVRMLIDRGAIETAGDPWRLQAEKLLATQVPATLTGVLQARLDGLPAPERLTLQEASVIGQVFWDRALLALDTQAETTLPSLVRRELALPRQDTPADGLREYAFKHAILHQVTYGTVLKRQRRELHAKLADWLAAQSQSKSARAGDFLSLTAQHYREAGDDANAAEFHARAAEHAANRMAHGAALEQTNMALALLDKAGERPAQAALRWRLLVARERSLDLMGDRDRQGADLDALDQLAEVLGDDSLRSWVASRRAFRALRMADWPACEHNARRAAALAETVLSTGIHGPGQSTSLTEIQEMRLSSLSMLGIAMGKQDRLGNAQTLLEKTLAEAKERALLRPQERCCISLAVLAIQRNDAIGNLKFTGEALALSQALGDRTLEARNLMNVGGGWLGLGNLKGARRDLEESLRLLRQNGDRAAEGVNLKDLSTLALWQGDDARALALAQSALDIALAAKEREREAEAALALGDAEAALGRPEQAAQAYERARSVAQQIGDAMQYDAGAGLARLALAQGDTLTAMREVQALLTQAGDVVGNVSRDVAAIFESAEAPLLIELTVHQVLTAALDIRAGPWLVRAHRGLIAQAAAIDDAELREMFLTNVPYHREIVALWTDQQTHH